MQNKQKLLISCVTLLPPALFAFSTGPVIQRTGAAVDGGTNCTACHRTFAPANSDPRGSVVISASPYTPGVKQMVTVTVSHPVQKRWGFQLIARLASDETQQAGTFTAANGIRVRCTNTQDAPCNGAAEYAEHASAPFTDVGAGFTFQIEWTPPAANAGDIHFYAAGNAANGDGSLNGDYIYTTKLFIPPAGACGLTDKPSISAVVNSASYASGIGPSSLISVFGSNFNLSGTHTMATADTAAGTFPRAAACAAVEINGSRVPVIFAGDQQINAQAPADLAAGPASVRVILNPDKPNQIASDAIMVQADSVAPALFEFGANAAAAINASTGAPVADPMLVGGGVAAKPGDIVTFWLTGCGATTPSFAEGTIVTSMAKVNGTVTVSIGGVAIATADILYAGLSPNSISGLYQMNVRIPAGLPDGNAAVMVKIGQAATQAGITIPIKN